MQDEDEFIQTLTIYKTGFESMTWKIISGIEIRTTRGKYFSVGKVSPVNKDQDYENQVSSDE